jgi:hypothetical protein
MLILGQRDFLGDDDIFQAAAAVMVHTGGVWSSASNARKRALEETTTGSVMSQMQSDPERHVLIEREWFRRAMEGAAGLPIL